jgi:hypothetical protein
MLDGWEFGEGEAGQSLQNGKDGKENLQQHAIVKENGKKAWM